MHTGDVSTAATAPLALAPWDGSVRAVRITRVRTVLTAPGPARIPLLLVRVETDQAGLVGWGCASDPQRPLAVKTVIDRYLGPMVLGRNALDTEDLHRLLSMSPYWRGGAVENHALAGIDLALWDIKARLCGLPVHQLMGGRVRDRIPVYSHADGRDAQEVIGAVGALIEQGYRFVRCQVGVPGSDTYGVHAADDDERAVATALRNGSWDERSYVTAVPRMFDAVRAAVGPDVGLLHDVHERVSPAGAIRLAQDLEPHRLLFLEDALAPEDLGWYEQMRAATSTPQAVGEVFSDIRTFLPLITARLIDFARIRIGAVGGLTPTLKLAHLCELTGVRLAIHGPGDISPVGHAGAIAVDASSAAFGIQESVQYPDEIHEVFPGAPQLSDGAFLISDAPGLGVEVDERAARRYPVPEPLEHDAWALLRHRDGSVARP